MNAAPRCLGVITLLFVVGCGRNTTGTDAAANLMANGRTESRANQANQKPIEFDKILSQLVFEAAGRQLIVVDLWATWCTYCLDELPHLSELQDRYPSEILCVALNVDLDAADVHLTRKRLKRIQAVQDQVGVTCRRAICSETMMNVTERLGLFSIPAVVVFDSQGNVVDKFDGEFTYRDHVERSVSSRLRMPAK